MSTGDALLTFVSVFVAALLAFYLDGLRERRATRRWLREYLGFYRGFMDSRGDEDEQNEAGVRRVEAALDGWLAARSPEQPVWGDIDAMNVNATVRFTGPLLNQSASLLPVDLMQRLFAADATAPMVTARSQFVTRLFESDVRSSSTGRSSSRCSRSCGPTPTSCGASRRSWPGSASEGPTPAPDALLGGWLWVGWSPLQLPSLVLPRACSLHVVPSPAPSR